VLKTPGHTPGSICLLNAGEKIIFTGDSIVETPVWLYLKHSNPLTVFHHSLKKIKARENDFKTLLPGHRPTPMERKQLDDLIHCSEEILTGVGTGKPTHTFAGDGLLWVHGKGQIIYDPEKLK
jgi:glyoxylase-like metal-dependent hydrolase (beta-lactamase superfamily II)